MMPCCCSPQRLNEARLALSFNTIPSACAPFAPILLPACRKLNHFASFPYSCMLTEYSSLDTTSEVRAVFVKSASLSAHAPSLQISFTAHFLVALCSSLSSDTEKHSPLKSSFASVRFVFRALLTARAPRTPIPFAA